MTDFVHDVPTDVLALYCVVGAVAATWFGVLFVKPFLRVIVGGDPAINQSIGFATSVFSLFYGLLVGLLAVAAYENSEEVEQSAFREATSVATLYAQMKSYPEPFRSEMQGMLRDYVLFTIHKDWPAHREGAALNGGANRTDAMRQRLATFAPQSTPEEIVHREAVRTFQEFTVARQERLAGIITRIPDVLWYAVAAGAVVNVLFLVMMRMRPVQHMILGGLASFFLGVMLFVILALDDPLRGDAGLPPEAMLSLWETRMIFDEPTI
jgi:hypothetical protein